VFERFTDRARRVIVLAQEEARRLDHNYIGTEHLLLGLSHEAEGVGARTLESLGVSLDAVRNQVEEIVGRGGASVPGDIPFTPRAKKVLELSLREAQRLGHNHIGTEHILLGLLREGDGVAAQVLVNLGAGLERVRDRAVEVLAGTPHEDDPQGVGAAAGPPRCPKCAASLTTAASYRLIEARAEAPDQEPVRVVVVYCRDCGAALGIAP
jgi:ATP-dependent Clp protease ATP-binding subunit ClpC